jgi:hypothetical protein
MKEVEGEMGANEDYLIRIGKALADDDASEISSLVLELFMFLNDDVTSISRFQRNQIDASSRGLRQMRAKLLSRREAQDSETYGNYGLASITDSIHQLEDALGAGWSNDDLKKLYNRIDHIYANTLDMYTDGLCGWMYNDGEPGDDQTRLRIEKLRYYRDVEFRKLKIAETQKTSVSMTQSTQATVDASIVINMSATIEQIDALPETSLSDDDKTLLKGMIADLADKDSRKRETKLQKLTNWLGDKGTDVFIAAMPYIVQIIKAQMGA